MNEKVENWEDLQLFMVVAREGGLSPAARITRRSAATLGRRMLALERHLDRELFVRHDRGYELTAEGRTLMDGLAEVKTRIDKVTTMGSGGRPVIKVSAGSWTALFLARHLKALLGDPPDLRLRFVMSEENLDISHREVLIGIRNTRPTQPTLAGRKLTRVDFAPYATKAAPDGWIKVLAETPSAQWLAKRVGTDALCEVTAPRNALDLALAGQGAAVLPCFIGDAENKLTRRGPVIPELSHDRWLVTHNDDRHLPEVRRAIDRLCAVLT